MGQASRLRLALHAQSRAKRDLLVTRSRGSSGRMGMPTPSEGGGGGGGAGVLRDFGGDNGGATRAGADEGEVLLVRVDDGAGAAGAPAPVRGLGGHFHVRGGDEAAAVAVREVGGGEGY